MSNVKYLIEPTSDDYLKGIVKDLSRVRQWVEGFQAAGGKGPAHQDVLWRAQMLLGDAKPARHAETEIGE